MNTQSVFTRDVYENARKRNYWGKPEFTYRSQNDIVEYCRDMANAINNEMRQRGHCWLIDQAFANGVIFSLDWTAIELLINSLNNGGVYRIDYPGLMQLVHVSSEMEEILLALSYRLSPVMDINKTEAQRTSLSNELNELKRQLEQAKQTKGALDIQISQLKLEAERLHTENENVQNGIKNQMYAAEARAEAIIKEANEKAGSIRAELLQGIAFDDQPESDSVKADDTLLRDKVGDETRRLENTIRTSLDSYRDEIHRMIYEFRTGLYEYDYTTLCSAYQKLFLFATNIFDKRIEALCVEMSDEVIKSQLQSSLRKVQGQLLKRVAVIEESLEKLGLIVFRPEKGEGYNDVYHAAENAEDDGYLEATIRCCVCPGIRTNEQVLCRAAVVVDMSERS